MLASVKVPLLYGAGFALLRAVLPPAWLVAGFGLVFAVVTLQALGSWLVHPSWRRGATALVLAVALAGAVAPNVALAKEHAAASAKAEAEAEAHEEKKEGGAPELPNVV